MAKVLPLLELVCKENPEIKADLSCYADKSVVHYVFTLVGAELPGGNEIFLAENVVVGLLGSVSNEGFGGGVSWRTECPNTHASTTIEFYRLQNQDPMWNGNGPPLTIEVKFTRYVTETDPASAIEFLFQIDSPFGNSTLLDTVFINRALRMMEIYQIHHTT